MKTIFLICLLLTSSIITCYSQNGGQLNENPSVKMEYVSVINGVTTLKITNKQNGVVEIQTKAGNEERVKSYNALSADTIKFVGLTGTNVKIQSKALTNLGTTDYGNVELFLNINSLPVKFVSFKSVLTPDGDAQITFEIAEAVNVKQFNVKMSKDGKTWQTVAIIFPDELQPNRIYSTKVKLP